ncbi:MAG TPA: helicase-associated domain-containing protein [Ktedonobacterales bacterium]|jgi:hypothetical protein
MQSLGSILASRELAELRVIAALWGVEPPRDTALSSLNRLENGIRDSISSRFVWEKLDDDERRVLSAILGPSARNWCLLEHLPEKTKRDSLDLRPVIDRLKRRRLVFEELAKIQGTELYGQRAVYFGYGYSRPTNTPVEVKPILYVPTEIATILYTTGRELFAPQGDRSQKTLDEILMPYRQGDLDQIGRRYGLILQAYSSRDDVRRAMAANLCQADAVRYALARLEPRLRALYEQMIAGDGRLPMHEVRRQTELDGPKLNAALHVFEEFAIAFDALSEGQRVLFIPQETLEHLRQDAGRPRVEVGLRECAAPRLVVGANPSFLWDVAMFVAAAHHHEIELTRSDTLHKRVASKLLPMLSGSRARSPDETEALEYLEMLKQEARELGLLAAAPQAEKAAEPAKTPKGRAKSALPVEESKGRLVIGPKLDAWAALDLAGQARRVFRRWTTDRWWVDRMGANYKEWYSYYIDVGSAREAVQKLLATCKPGVWYTLASLRATLQGDDPFVFRPVQRFAGEAGFKYANQLREHWEQTDGEVVAGMLRSSLFEMGIVALGYQRDTPLGPTEDTNPDAFMLTELGAVALGLCAPAEANGHQNGAVALEKLGQTAPLSAASQAQAETLEHAICKRPLIIQPNFEVLVMEPCISAIYGLPRYAVPVQIGQVSRFTLTREALLRGLADGRSLDDILTYLERNSQKALPQNIAYTLRDWARQYKEARVNQLIVLELSDEALTEQLATMPKLAALGLRRLGPCALVAPGDANLRELRRALEKLGVAVKFGGGLEDQNEPEKAPARKERSRVGAKR